jgi:hypothetical protein
MGALSTEYNMWFVGQTTASTWRRVVEAPAMNALRFLPEETAVESSSPLSIFTIDDYQYSTINPIHASMHPPHVPNAPPQPAQYHSPTTIYTPHTLLFPFSTFPLI